MVVRILGRKRVPVFRNSDIRVWLLSTYTKVCHKQFDSHHHPQSIISILCAFYSEPTLDCEWKYWHLYKGPYRRLDCYIGGPGASFVPCGPNLKTI